MSLVYFTDRDLGKSFPRLLLDAGVPVERHGEHFPADCPDEVWLAEVGKRGWVALTHDTRIRYKPNEKGAVIRNSVRLIDIVGKASLRDLATSFIASRSRIELFLKDASGPLIAKLYRASPGELAQDPHAPGRIERWFPKP